MAGALAERVFATKLYNVGFIDLTVVDRRPFSIDDAAAYPMFTDDLLDLMADLLPPERHARIATVVTMTARRPDTPGQDTGMSTLRAGKAHDG